VKDLLCSLLAVKSKYFSEEYGEQVVLDCFIQEAQALSSLKAQLDEIGFRLFAVVHELKGAEQFKPFFDGEIYLDEQVIHPLYHN